MKRSEKISAIFIAIVATVATSMIDKSVGLSIVVFCSVICLFIGMALTEENS